MFLTNSFSRLPPKYPTPPKTEIFLVLIFDNTTVEWDSIYLEDIKYGSKLKNYIIHKYNLDYNKSVSTFKRYQKIESDIRFNQENSFTVYSNKFARPLEKK